jgi:hypothetical protein
MEIKPLRNNIILLVLYLGVGVSWCERLSPKLKAQGPMRKAKSINVSSQR